MWPGCFDLLHPGHITYLQAARKLGDVLIVGVNDDDSVAALKGPLRPVLALHLRMHMLAALESVDAVTPLYGRTNIALLEALEPDLWVKGGDYQLDTLDADEVATAKRLGTEIRILPLVHECSTSSLLSLMHR